MIDPNAIPVRLDDHERRILHIEGELAKTHRGLADSERRMEERITALVARANELLVSRLDAQDKQAARVEGMVQGAVTILKVIGALLTLACVIIGAYAAIMTGRH